MRRWNRQVIFALVLCLGMSPGAWASLGDPSSNSASYRVVESEIGGNGQFTAGSSSYSICGATCFTDDAGTSLGESAVGNSSSASYQTNSGFNTTAQPGLTLNVSGTPANLGLLTLGAAKTATATFNVKNYTTWGYAVTIIGTPPSSRGHSLVAMGTQSSNSSSCSPSCSSSPGVTEQFGINLRANPSLGEGTDPVPIPNASFSQYLPGTVLPLPYRTQDSYRYFPGDTIASTIGNSGETDYTISFIANMVASTPAGTYSGNLSIVATGTY
jgi:hypothetical protein